MDLNEILEKIEEFHKIIKAEENYFKEKGRLSYINHKAKVIQGSMLLDGTSFELEHILTLLKDNMVVEARSLDDYFKLAGFAEAYEFMMELGEGGATFLSDDILQGLHFLLHYHVERKEAGYYRKATMEYRNINGALPDEIPEMLAAFYQTVNERWNIMNPVLLAIFIHQGFMSILPFSQRNVEMALFLMNLLLVSKGYGVFSVPPKKHKHYYELLDEALWDQAKPDTQEMFSLFMCECILEAIAERVDQ